MKYENMSITDILTKKLKTNPIDWETVEDLIKQIDDINKIEDDETILTDFLINSFGEIQESTAIELIKRFIKNGYDLKANEGKNGGLILSQICWFRYDSVVDIAKFLLDSGAPTEYDNGNRIECECSTVIYDICWNLSGYWGPDCYYDYANILEAYYCVVEAFESRKDYHLIDSYKVCLGKTLTKVSVVSDEKIKELRDNASKIKGTIVFWFGNIPLVVDKYLTIVSNSLYSSENLDKMENAEHYFNELIGSKIKKIVYIDSCICYLEFSNGKRLLLANVDLFNEDRSIIMEIIDKQEYVNISREKLKYILVDSRAYSKDACEYHDNTIAFQGQNACYILYNYKGLQILKCSRDLSVYFEKQLDVGDIKDVELYCNRKGDRVKGMRLSVGEKYFYVVSGNWFNNDAILYKASEEKADLIIRNYFEHIQGIHIKEKKLEHK